MDTRALTYFFHSAVSALRRSACTAFVGAAAMTLLFAECRGQEAAFPAGYDLRAPQTMELPDAIDEISGIAWNEADKSIYAIDDNEGKIFRITGFPKAKVEQWEVGAPRDFEDIVVQDGKAFVLGSKGEILTVPLGQAIGDAKPVKLEISGKRDFETLFSDGSGRLVLLCKECESDGKEAPSAYRYDPATSTFSDGSVMSLEGGAGKKGKARIRPSAAAFHPKTGELYILASADKLLLVADGQLRVKARYALDGKLFKQPEGITFAPNGDLYISNEAAKKGPANILLFRWKQ